MKRTESTRQRILDSALQLFNASGTASVSTNHVAAEAGLSVGNLYYHYKSKQQIIRALFDQNEAEVLSALAPPSDRPLNIDDLELMMKANFQILWKYRFLYRELVALLIEDPELATSFRDLRHRGFSNFERLLQFFAASGVLRPIEDPEELSRLTHLCWLISEFYISYVESGLGLLQTVEGEGWQEKGLALLWHVIEPYRPPHPESP